MTTVVSLEDFTEFMGLTTSSEDVDTRWAQECLTDAKDEVADYMSRFAVSDNIPDSKVRDAIRKAAQDKYNQRSAPWGITQFTNPGDGVPMRVSLDTMKRAKAVLADYVTAWGF
jgi:hypothetical protein